MILDPTFDPSSAFEKFREYKSDKPAAYRSIAFNREFKDDLSPLRQSACPGLHMLG
jgi:hypothetical protein